MLQCLHFHFCLYVYFKFQHSRTVQHLHFPSLCIFQCIVQCSWWTFRALLTAVCLNNLPDTHASFNVWVGAHHSNGKHTIKPFISTNQPTWNGPWEAWAAIFLETLASLFVQTQGSLRISVNIVESLGHTIILFCLESLPFVSQFFIVMQTR